MEDLELDAVGVVQVGEPGADDLRGSVGVGELVGRGVEPQACVLEVAVDAVDVVDIEGGVPGAGVVSSVAGGDAGRGVLDEFQGQVVGLDDPEVHGRSAGRSDAAGDLALVMVLMKRASMPTMAL